MWGASTPFFWPRHFFSKLLIPYKTQYSSLRLMTTGLIIRPRYSIISGSVTEPTLATKHRQWRSQEIFSGGAKIRGSLGDGSPPVGSRVEVPVGGLGAKSPRSWRLNRKKPSNLSSREHHCAYCCSKPWGLSISSLHLSPTLLELGSLTFLR